MVAQNNK